MAGNQRPPGDGYGGPQAGYAPPPGQAPQGYPGYPPQQQQQPGYAQQHQQQQQQQAGYPQQHQQQYPQAMPPAGYPPAGAGAYAPYGPPPGAQPAGYGAQGAYGAPQPAGYGPQGGYGAPPPAGYAPPGAPQGGYAPPPVAAPAQGSWAAVGPAHVQSGPWAGFRPPAGARSLGLFEAIPCPACGAKTYKGGAVGSMIASRAAGLVGYLIYHVVIVNYACPTHGVVPKEAFPAEHKNAITLRRAVKLVIAIGLLMLVFALIIARATLTRY